VDLARKRIALTMRLDAKPEAAGRSRGADNSFRPAGRGQPRPRTTEQAGGGAMAAAFAKLQGRRG
jgi:uncharacterized protein